MKSLVLFHSEVLGLCYLYHVVVGVGGVRAESVPVWCFAGLLFIAFDLGWCGYSLV